MLPLTVLPIRRSLISLPVLKLFSKLVPKMSDTESEAIEAGTIGWEAELFSGKPKWHKLLSFVKPTLSKAEQDFLDGPTEELCRMVDDWQIVHKSLCLPTSVWDYMKSQGFLGLCIPKQYGGKGFSALMHSAVITKLSTKSVTVAATVSVPNSLGPAELLLHYGTKKQKDHYLPRLAAGKEVPCFALTSASAGSDAGSMTDHGVVCYQPYKGKKTLGIRLNVSKRYITLAPIATLIGLAFKLYDPDQLLGKTESLGITCALVPRKTKGLKIGRRHYPIGAPFQNGPIQGEDVFIPLDWVIGGKAMVGHGWRMLMECLAEGRSISLPSQVCGGVKSAIAATGAYARIRHQFNLPIGFFGGVEEALAKLGGFGYLIDSLRIFSVSAIDRDEKSAVASAISKYHATELARQASTQAMDIHGGRAICLGPKNYLANSYNSLPISITVEGANILTRSLIIFGQGAIRCHPYLLDEMKLATSDDPKQSLPKFDRLMFGHLGLIFSNLSRSLLLGLSHGYLASVPAKASPKVSYYYRQFSRFSAAFGLMADVSMGVYGASLKRREKISARLGDVLSMLYLGSAALKHYHDTDSPEEDFPLICWSCDYLLHEIQQKLDELLTSLPHLWLRVLLRPLIFPLGRFLRPPKDKHAHQIAQLLLTVSSAKQRLIAGSYLAGDDPKHPMGQVHHALQEMIDVEPLIKQLNQYRKEGVLEGRTMEEWISSAEKNKLFDKQEIKQLISAQALYQTIISVDDFDNSELLDRGES